MIIKSKNFILRPYRKGDEKSLSQNISHRHIYRYTLNIPFPYTVSNAKRWIDYNKKISKSKNIKEINFAIDKNGKVIGGVGFREMEKEQGEIGYWLGNRYWNRGIMTEAIKLFTDFGFQKLKLTKIYAPVFSMNKASARVLQKNGYNLEKSLQNHGLKDGKPIDAVMFAKVKNR